MKKINNKTGEIISFYLLHLIVIPFLGFVIYIMIECSFSLSTIWQIVAMFFSLVFTGVEFLYVRWFILTQWFTIKNKKFTSVLSLKDYKNERNN